MIDWLERHGVSPAAIEWATKHCTNLDDVWLHATRGEWVVWLATRPGVLSDETLKRFLLFCVHKVVNPKVLDPSNGVRELLLLNTTESILAGTTLMILKGDLDLRQGVGSVAAASALAQKSYQEARDEQAAWLRAESPNWSEE